MRIERDQITTAAVLAAMLLVCVLGGWMPNRFRAARLESRIAEARSQLGLGSSGGEDVKQLARQVRELQDAINKTQKHIPQDDELADLLRRISEQLDDQAVVEPTIRTHSVRQGTDYRVIPIELRFEGSFPSAFGFVEQLESMRRLVRIDRLEVEADRKQRHKPLAVALDLSTFCAMPAPAAGASQQGGGP